MPRDTGRSTRRTLLFAAALGGLPLLARPNRAQAAGTLAKADAKYQETPNGGNSCATCVYFLPGDTPKAAGQCKVVAGSILPQAWCQLFGPKPR
jgi:hypothetical protein